MFVKQPEIGVSSSRVACIFDIRITVILPTYDIQLVVSVLAYGRVESVQLNE